MKRIFLILCLITICNISYADIASVGYVDSVVAGKQDTITDIETIRTGAGLGATAVQPSSLSVVATSGSYNDLTNKPTIPNIPTGPNDGNKYTLVWDGKAGRFMFEEMPAVPLQCSSGQYDIGFDQCVDPDGLDNRVVYQGFYSHDGDNRSDDDFFGLSTGGWGVFIGDIEDGIMGTASCNNTSGDTAGLTYNNDSSNWAQPANAFDRNSTGGSCWCKMTYPSTSHWVFTETYGGNNVAAACAYGCAFDCVAVFMRYSSYRSAMFGSVDQ